MDLMRHIEVIGENLLNSPVGWSLNLTFPNESLFYKDFASFPCISTSNKLQVFDEDIKKSNH